MQSSTAAAQKQYSLGNELFKVIRDKDSPDIQLEARLVLVVIVHEVHGGFARDEQDAFEFHIALSLEMGICQRLVCRLQANTQVYLWCILSCHSSVQYIYARGLVCYLLSSCCIYGFDGAYYPVIQLCSRDTQGALSAVFVSAFSPSLVPASMPNSFPLGAYNGLSAVCKSSNLQAPGCRHCVRL